MNNDIVIIQLDRPRQLKFTHSALKTLVDISGKSIEEIETSFEPGNFELIETLAYCALLKDAKDHGETLSLERVVELLDEAPHFSHIIEKLTDAFIAAMRMPNVVLSQQEGNEPLPEEAKQVPAKRNTTGKRAKE